MSSDVVDALIKRAEAAWSRSIERWAIGEERYFVTEEHMLNYAVAALPRLDLSAYIARVWTARKHRAFPQNVMELAMWHLPGEKDRGIPRIYALATDRRSRFWWSREQEFQSLIGGIVGVPRRRIARWVDDEMVRAGRRVLAAFRWVRWAAVPTSG